MQSEPKTPEIDPRDVGIAPETTEPPGRIYKQVVREVLARIDQRLADIERQAVTEPAEGRASGRAPLRNRLKRVSVGLLVMAGVIGAVVVWQRFDGDTAKAMVARFTPGFLTDAPATQDDQEAAQGAGSMTVGTAADGTPSSDARSAMADTPAAPLDRTTPEPDGQQTTASVSPDMASTIEKMSRDIATLGQGIEELKASQEQLSRDSAKATEQFKASEDQLIRMLLRVSEQQTPQPKAAVPTPPRTKPPQARTGAAPPRGTWRVRARDCRGCFRGAPHSSLARLRAEAVSPRDVCPLMGSDACTDLIVPL